jgi:hypothetical protein
VLAFEKDPHLLTNSFTPTSLPLSLFTDKANAATLSAVDLFKADTWFSDSINLMEEKTTHFQGKNVLDCDMKLGDKIKQTILMQYRVSTFN